MRCAASIDRLLRDDDLRDRLGEAARTRAAGELSYDVLAQRLAPLAGATSACSAPAPDAGPPRSGTGFVGSVRSCRAFRSRCAPESPGAGPATDDLPGRGIIRAAWLADLLFAVAAVPAVAGVEAFEGVALAVSLVLFAISLGVWVYAFAIAVGRSARGTTSSSRACS